MTDTTTNKPLCVSSDAKARPFITLPVSQLDDLRRLLDSRKIPYWVDENFISFNGGPEEAFVTLGREADPATVQAVLDSVH